MQTSQHATVHAEHPAPSNTHVEHATTHSEHPANNNPPVQHVQQPVNVVPATRHPARIPSTGHPGQFARPAPSQWHGSHAGTSIGVQPAAPTFTRQQQEEMYAQDQGFRSAEQYRKWKQTGRLEASVTSSAPSGQPQMKTAASGIYHDRASTVALRHFDLPKTYVPDKDKVAFQPGAHIPDCHKWQDPKYAPFRNYTSTWHDRTWWITHHPRIILVLGGAYYWNAGYWFPAWGYHPDAVYAYDGPIYAYDNLPPDQVTANVQTALQELGYYHGPINGILDSATRAAIASYQQDHGLYITSAIDESTLTALGMT